MGRGKVRYIVTTLTCMLVMLKIAAQQESQYTQYMYNTISFNPAYTGSRENPSFLLLHRTQWVGIDGAPETQNFSFHTPLRNKNVGLGLVVINDKIGPSNEVNINFNYSYTLYFENSVKLALGISAGIQNLDTDWSKGTFKNQLDPNFQENIDLFKPTFGLGSFLYSEDWYVGMSVPNILTTQYFDYVQSSQATQNPEVYITGGYVFYLNPNLKFKPATLTKIASGSPMALDLSANFLYREQFVLGLAGSLNNSLSVLTGFHINPNIFLGYSFDYNTNNIGNYNSGSHEVFLRFELSKTRYLSPRFF